MAPESGQQQACQKNGGDLGTPWRRRATGSLVSADCNGVHLVLPDFAKSCPVVRFSPGLLPATLQSRPFVLSRPLYRLEALFDHVPIDATVSSRYGEGAVPVTGVHEVPGFHEGIEVVSRHGILQMEARR